MSAQSGYIDVGDGQIYYESVGDGADAIVFIHGRAGDRRHWDAQFDTFGIDYRVVRYDVRCFGKSSNAIQDHVYSDRADLLQLLGILYALERSGVQCLPRVPVERGFGVEALHVADAAAHEEPDHALRFRREVGLAIGRSPLARLGAKAIPLQHGVQREPGEAEAR